jgi:hypothetical protein
MHMMENIKHKITREKILFLVIIGAVLFSLIKFEFSETVLLGILGCFVIFGLYLLNKNIFTYLVIFLIPFYWVPLYSGRFSILKISSIVAFFILFTQNLMIKIKIDRIFIFIICFLGVWYISALLNDVKNAFQMNTISNTIMWYILIPYVLSEYIKKYNVKWLISLILALCFFEALLLFLQISFGETFYLQNYIKPEQQELLQKKITLLKVGEYYSPFGTFDNRHNLGVFLLMGFTISLSLLFFKNYRRWTLKILIGICTLGILFTFSRTAITGIGLVLLSLLFLLKKYNLIRYQWRRLIPIIVILMVFLQIMPALRIGIVERVSPETYGGWRESLEYREYTTLASLKAFATNPVIGVGPYNFSPNSHIWLREVNAPQILYEKEAHNAYTELFAELGLLGGVLFIILLTMLINYLRYAITVFRKNENQYLFAVSIAMFAIVIMQLFAHLIGNSVISGFNHFSVLLGFAIGLRSLALNIDNDLIRISTK